MFEAAQNIDFTKGLPPRRLGYVKVFGVKVLVRDWTLWGKLMIKLTRSTK